MQHYTTISSTIHFTQSECWCSVSACVACDEWHKSEVSCHPIICFCDGREGNDEKILRKQGHSCFDMAVSISPLGVDLWCSLVRISQCWTLWGPQGLQQLLSSICAEIWSSYISWKSYKFYGTFFFKARKTQALFWDCIWICRCPQETDYSLRVVYPAVKI